MAIIVRHGNATERPLFVCSVHFVGSSSLQFSAALRAWQAGGELNEASDSPLLARFEPHVHPPRRSHACHANESDHCPCGARGGRAIRYHCLPFNVTVHPCDAARPYQAKAAMFTSPKQGRTTRLFLARATSSLVETDRPPRRYRKRPQSCRTTSLPVTETR